MRGTVQTERSGGFRQQCRYSVASRERLGSTDPLERATGSRHRSARTGARNGAAMGPRARTPQTAQRSAVRRRHTTSTPLLAPKGAGARSTDDATYADTVAARAPAPRLRCSARAPPSSSFASTAPPPRRARAAAVARPKSRRRRAARRISSMLRRCPSTSRVRGPPAPSLLCSRAARERPAAERKAGRIETRSPPHGRAIHPTKPPPPQTHRRLVVGVPRRLRERPHAVEKAKAREPPRDARRSADVRRVKVERRLRCDAVVPHELVLLVQLHAGGEAWGGGGDGVGRP